MGSVERKAERCEEAERFHEVAGVSDVVAGGPHSTTGTLAVDSRAPSLSSWWGP